MSDDGIRVRLFNMLDGGLNGSLYVSNRDSLGGNLNDHLSVRLYGRLRDSFTGGLNRSLDGTLCACILAEIIEERAR